VRTSGSTKPPPRPCWHLAFVPRQGGLVQAEKCRSAGSGLAPLAAMKGWITAVWWPGRVAIVRGPLAEGVGELVVVRSTIVRSVDCVFVFLSLSVLSNLGERWRGLLLAFSCSRTLEPRRRVSRWIGTQPGERKAGVRRSAFTRCFWCLTRTGPCCTIHQQQGRLWVDASRSPLLRPEVGPLVPMPFGLRSGCPRSRLASVKDRSPSGAGHVESADHQESNRFGTGPDRCVTGACIRSAPQGRMTEPSSRWEPVRGGVGEAEREP
jgi:hypothetical protein